MADSQGGSPLFRTEIKSSGSDSASDWMALLKELRGKDVAAGTSDSEGPLTASKQDTPTQPMISVDDGKKDAPPAAAGEKKLSRYEELCRKPSMTMGQADMMVMSEFSEIIAQVNRAGKALTALREHHPDAIPHRILKTCVENLKDASSTMLHEFHHMRHGREQKKYDNRYVCINCHEVFMVPLPLDRLCDKCRAERTPASAPY